MIVGNGRKGSPDWKRNGVGNQAVRMETSRLDSTYINGSNKEGLNEDRDVPGKEWRDVDLHCLKKR